MQTTILTIGIDIVTYKYRIYLSLTIKSCSKFNFDLCYNLKVIDNPRCSCGAHYENVHHFFIECPYYLDIRLNLFSVMSIYTEVTLDTILHGHFDLTIEQNKIVFDAVHSYILNSERFK